MKTLILMLLSTTFTSTAIVGQAQNARTIQIEDTFPHEFDKLEFDPVFPGGEEARMQYIIQNIRYPIEARKNDIQGVVYVSFVVDRDGHIRDVEVVRGIGGGCDEEAVRLVRNMPRWKPGRQKGKNVHVQYTMPLKFTLID